MNEARTTASPVATHKNILLVEDHDLVRLGTCVLLESFEDIRCTVQQCKTLDEALQACHRGQSIDLVLLDLNLHDSKGLQGLRSLREAFPALPVAVLSGTHDEFVVRQAQAMGAAGYLLKSWTPEQLRAAIRSLLAATDRGAASLAERFPRLAGTSYYDRVAELGPRHIQILELILSGCNNQEISNATQLSLGTVKNYVSAILLALDVRSRAHLISLFH
ncbi:MAG TPA: response regulator transcription factor [Burkholderiaceae bacterium]|nr:response regulator transcription factor [Burkholderiaceae bacterium]